MKLSKIIHCTSVAQANEYLVDENWLYLDTVVGPYGPVTVIGWRGEPATAGQPEPSSPHE